MLDYFWELKKCAPEGFSSRTITPEHIEAWARVTNRVIRPWVARALLAMDYAQREVIAARNAKKKE